MVDYADSSQLNLWLFKSPQELACCRAKANYKARMYLFEREGKKNSEPDTSQSHSSAADAQPTAECFAPGFSKRIATGDETLNVEYYESTGPQHTAMGNHLYLTPAEEAKLVDFYVSKLPSLIGPTASVQRLSRCESKVPATAALLLRRFFLSNSVMLFDPKTIMVAAAFLGSKVEESMVDIRYLEEGTNLMNAPVSQQEIIPAEVALVAGTHFDLLCFHPYKPVMALTGDLRTFLKTEKGQFLLRGGGGGGGGGGEVKQDLNPIYHGARLIVDEAILSDIPLLYSPGQVGLAALILAAEQLPDQSTSQLDLRRYLPTRFGQRGQTIMRESIDGLIEMLSQIYPKRQQDSNAELSELKEIHKKLKKVRVWGNAGGKKKKKVKKEESNEDANAMLPPPNKRPKTEA